MQTEKKSPVKIFVILVVASLFILLLDRGGFLKTIRGGLENIIIPIEKSIYQKKLTFTDTSSEIEQLKSENRKLAKMVANIDSCVKENQDMRRLLNAPLPTNWKYLPAQIIGYNDGVLLIDKGVKDKVSAGAVAVYEDSFVGRIDSSGENISRLITVLSPESKILVVVKDKAKGLLVSKNNKLYLQKVLLDEDLQTGDLVFTDIQYGLLPGLPVGRITRVIKKDNEIFQEAEVETFVDFQKISNVFLINLK